MSQAISTTPSVEIPSIPVTRTAPWALFFALAGGVAVYFLAADQAPMLHEWVHDGRHLLGIPCH